MNQELDKVLYHAVSSYQLLEVMLHRLLFHSESAGGAAAAGLHCGKVPPVAAAGAPGLF